MPESNACYSEGTMANFRSRFGHTQASQNVDKSFNYSYALFCFTMQSYVTALAMKLLNFSEPELDSIPSNLTNSVQDPEKMKAILDSVSRKILDFEWRDVDRGIRQRK
jgi:hypothetical protein